MLLFPVSTLLFKVKDYAISNAKKFKLANLLIIQNQQEQWPLIDRAIQQRFPQVKLLRADSFQQTKTLFEQWRHQEWDIPKLILVDLALPTHKQGWQLLRFIKALAAPFNQIPIVALSQSILADDINQAYQLGVASYVVKPAHEQQWLAFFEQLRTYWWETVTLPPTQYGS